MFKSVLIANRGEIAVRVTQTVQEMGMRAVAVFSDPDRQAVHVRTADEAYPLHGVTAAETYLDIQKIIGIAKSHAVDAIHPGYGFLSENADFAQACADAGIVFIGPTPEAIRAMGDKIVAKRGMIAAGVPVVPGWSGPSAEKHDSGESDSGEADSKVWAAEAERIGYPVLVKAAAGGGGKGMRVVASAEEFAGAFAAAQREAGSAFGDARVFLEKYVTRPRHVEFQVFGDTHGNVVHLFERECSIQRRHQKIVEESPSPALTPALREKMGAAAVEAVRSIGYVNAGTVEFMVDASGAFYFLEVNTRLQVEHPVTEMVTGLDLVRVQIMVAAGEALPFTQDSIRQVGHAVECRIYAEDAAKGFLPSTGVLKHYREPSGVGVRVDSGVTAGSEITVHYDPMISKLIVWAGDREAALARMSRALRRYPILGVTTNVEFLANLMGHEAFRRGSLHTHFLEEHSISATSDAPPDEAVLAAVMTLGAVRRSSAGQGVRVDAERAGPWQTAGAWRMTS